MWIQLDRFYRLLIWFLPINGFQISFVIPCVWFICDIGLFEDATSWSVCYVMKIELSNFCCDFFYLSFLCVLVVWSIVWRVLIFCVVLIVQRNRDKIDNEARKTCLEIIDFWLEYYITVLDKDINTAVYRQVGGFNIRHVKNTHPNKVYGPYLVLVVHFI